MNTIQPHFSPGDQMVDRDLFRSAMASVGAAVHIVTTDGAAGRAGFAATAICSVSDTPPTLLVCLNRSSSVYQAFKENGVLTVNTLTPSHTVLSGLFGGKTPMEERFAAARWLKGETGAPVLADAAVSFDCIIDTRVPSGTHDVLFCRVVMVREGQTDDVLAYHQRRYHRLGQPSLLEG
ncbi:flavin reductase [Rhizobium paknamense]|uniref:FMN reductase (NADH) RutF n=1 Tax=Rhizobium paknamense TaxID=1206817 RepID=A0ABU0IEU0_9HYPH|nr:flavin reductase [Rhizobium paknamense]MDQ0456763.1 flavin reductase [Rhizobium paknamense]